LLLYSSYLPLGVPNGTVFYINTAATSNNVSQLKQAIVDPSQVSTELPSYHIVTHDSIHPAVVLGERFIRQGGKMVPQVRVQWSGFSANCLTWERVDVVVQQFPDASAWGQAGSTGGGICHNPPARSCPGNYKAGRDTQAHA
jgi:hypothetical protein